MIRRMLVLLCLFAAACAADEVSLDRRFAAVSQATTQNHPEPRAATSTASTTTTSSPTTTTTTTTSTTSTVPPTTAPTTTATVTTTTREPVERVVVETGYSTFAVVGPADGEAPIALFHPSAKVERIGFHESGHDGSRQMDATETTARPMTLETHDRGARDRTAADIVVPPDEQIRVPVTGTVLRSGGYTLYCDHQDDFAVIEPDGRPGWEVKIFHIDGVAIRKGERVEAGVTVLAPRATQLPFESQVDEFTGEPSWPHVHVEVVDPSIPDRPSSGSGC